MNTALAIYDFPSIKRFVFGTDRAREIRGASALLEDLNINVIPSLLKDSFGTRLDVVYSGGGSGMFLIAGSSVQDVDAAFAKIGATVADRTGGGAEIIWGAVPQSGTFANSTRAAHLLLGSRKGRRHGAIPVRGHALFAECDSCSRPGVTGCWCDSPDEVEWLCPVCLLKRKRWKASVSWRQLEEYLGLVEDSRPDDFNDLGEHCPRSGYLALIYADGDSMGRLVKGVPSADQYRVFSRTVDKCLRTATFDAVRTHAFKAGQKHLFCDILLLGGDDLLMVVPAQLGLPMALEIAERFQTLTRQEFASAGFFDARARSAGLTVSAGIAIFKARQPFRVAFDQAEALLGSAKRRRAELNSDEPFIDLADVSQTRFVDLDDLRRVDQGVGTGVELTLWPMSLGEARVLLNSARELKAKGIANSRLHALSEIAERRQIVSFETMRIIAHARHDAPALAKFFVDTKTNNPIPWRAERNVKRTGLVDLANLCRLIG